MALNTILAQLKTDMVNKIDPANDYKTRPVVKHGIYSKSDLDGKFPCICFEVIDEEIASALGKNKIMMYYYITLYGYAKADGVRNTNSIKTLAHDVLYFIFNADWTYTDDTWIDSKVTYFISTESDNVSMFEFTIKVKDAVTVSEIRE